MQGFKKTGQKLLLLVCSISLIFITLEIGMRVWICHFANERHVLKYASVKQLEKKHKDIKPRWSVHRYLGHYPTPDFEKGKNKHNSLGYRGDEIVLPKPEGQFRIVCLGGSTTYTTELEDFKMSYPNLLEKELRERGFKNINVVNAGVGAYTSWESLINFELRVLDLDPDMIIIYHGVNDILARFVWPPDAYKGDNSGAASAPSMSMPSILEYSTLMRYLMIRLGIIQPHSTLERSLKKVPKTNYAIEFFNQKERNKYPAGIFRQVSAQKILMTNEPEYFRRNIENIVVIAQFREIETVIATFAYCPNFNDSSIVSCKEYILEYDEMNQVLKSVTEKMHVNIFDFAELFPKDEIYFTDGIHVNAEGVKLKAKMFADYLISKELLPK
ncbi:MAG: GDSL-type esterase/lipase family protein [Phycisphaerales bacterium]